jgi:iron complex transport system ATP-binding protein
VGVGENVAILGPNGSGKSSLIGLLTRELYPYPDGAASSMRVLGRDRWDLFELRRHLGVVTPSLQADYARPVLAREAVLSGFFGSIGLFRNHRVTRAMERRAERTLEELEVPHLADRPMSELSAGEARRVLIGRALVHRPRALVLDEPTSSLDLRAARDFRLALRRLSRRGTNVILVTHDLEDVIPEISRAVLLRQGRIFRDGRAREILTAANLTALYGMRITGPRAGGRPPSSPRP